MATPEAQLETQLRNIEAHTGRSRDELYAYVLALSETGHMARVKHLKAELGLGHGDANTLVHMAKKSQEAPAPADHDPADAWYAGKKAGLRPLHDAVMAVVEELCPGAEHAPKKTYVSLRRRKQFAMVGPGTTKLLEIGFNLKGVPGEGNVQALGPGKMCTHRRRIASVEEVDDELRSWLRRAWEAAE